MEVGEFNLGRRFLGSHRPFYELQARLGSFEPLRYVEPAVAAVEAVTLGLRGSEWWVQIEPRKLLPARVESTGRRQARMHVNAIAQVQRLATANDDGFLG
jgi:hypothetical protein